MILEYPSLFRYHYSMNQLLLRSDEFEIALNEALNEGAFKLFDDSPKLSICANACLLSLEHASSVRVLFAADAPHSATGLLRLQYEALLRAAWVLYAANELQLSKLTPQLDIESEHAANKLPGPADMLKALETKAPIGLIQPLNEFKTVAIKGLNSFVHGGIHPLTRIKEGFPEVLALQLVRNSNGLMHFGYRMLASLTGSQTLMSQITHLYGAFADCSPSPTSSRH
jgi:hypothetical protein